ncbi:Cof-type HAD-IIB family hydrolase [Clostridium sp. CX1]|uniref:Cof-type HAD-IIB family hydrolase n=1 Tax=Clostridium sp. CX1 TaxID=2978346 RepID=UPI0021C052E4|nr:Cof-type HAD-IIB family hydrolase [Clostridium sp. CX1]MCT8977083.1 Cof-type HAD-IIB family hydrolase [Clostridium sp. CX1]
MKLIATDLDGTLLNSNHEISQENSEALRLAKEKGIEIAIATGRTYSDARHLCKKADINAHIISNNGSLIFSKEGKKLKSWTIDKDSLEYVLNWLNENEYLYEISTAENLFIPHNAEDLLRKDFDIAKTNNSSLKEELINNMITLIFSQKGIKPVKCKDDILKSNLDFCSITAVSFDKNKLNHSRDHYRKFKELSMVISNEYNFELVNKDASKGNSLEYLSKHLEIPLESVAAFGDNYNDVSMFKKVGISVAMGNADDDIKKICKYVSLSNNLNGVAHFIGDFISNLKAKSTPA